MPRDETAEPPAAWLRRPARGAAADRLAARAGLSLEQARRLVSLDCVFCGDQGELVVAAESGYSLATAPTLVCYLMALPPGSEHDTASATRGLFSAWPGAERVVLRCEGLASPGPPFEALTYYFAKDAVDSGDDPDVRPVDATTTPFVHELLLEAMLAGHVTDDDTADLVARYRAYIAEHFDFSAGSPVAALVLLDGSRPLGHVTWHPESFDVLTGERFAEIVDCGVPQALQGRGHATRLMRACESRLASEGRTMLADVVAHHDQRDRVLVERMLEHGWRPHHGLWAVRRGELWPTNGGGS